MKISFQQILQPLHEAIMVNGESFFIGRPYDNIRREDDNLIVTFLNSGTVHIELKECKGLTAQEAYVRCNNFISTIFGKRISVEKEECPDITTFFGYIECPCLVQRQDEKYVRTLNFDNALTVFKDGRPSEHDGINIYIKETPYADKSKKKNKKGKK